MSLLDRYNRTLLSNASGRNLLVMLGITVLSFWLMAGVITPAFQEATSGLRPFDLNFGISAEKMYADLPLYTDQSRRLYVWFALADFVYPAAASAFFALLWAWLFKKSPFPFYARLTAAGVLMVPFMFALVDWLENLGFLWVVFQYPHEYPGVGNLAGTLKKIKPFVELVIVLLTLAFAAITIWRRRGSPARDGNRNDRKAPRP